MLNRKNFDIKTSSYGLQGTLRPEATGFGDTGIQGSRSVRHSYGHRWDGWRDTVQ